MLSRCELGKPGPHHYDCDRPKDEMVRCVCRNCGDERSYPAAGEFLLNRRGRIPRPDPVPVEDENELEGDQEVLELVAMTEAIYRTGFWYFVRLGKAVLRKEEKEVAMVSKSKRKKRQEYEAAKDNIIETWHRHHEDISATAQELSIPKSSLYGKLRQWGLIPLSRQAKKKAVGRTTKYEDQRDHIIAVYKATKGRRADGHSMVEAARILGILRSTLAGKLEQWGIVPACPAHRKWGWPRVETSADGANGLGAIEEVERLLQEASERREGLQKTITGLDGDIAALETTLRLLQAKQEVEAG